MHQPALWRQGQIRGSGRQGDRGVALQNNLQTRIRTGECTTIIHLLRSLFEESQVFCRFPGRDILRCRPVGYFDQGILFAAARRQKDHQLRQQAQHHPVTASILHTTQYLKWSVVHSKRDRPGIPRNCRPRHPPTLHLQRSRPPPAYRMRLQRSRHCRTEARSEGICPKESRPRSGSE